MSATVVLPQVSEPQMRQAALWCEERVRRCRLELAATDTRTDRGRAHYAVVSAELDDFERRLGELRAS